MNKEKIARMTSPERLKEMEAERLIALMQLDGEETVIDAGAGPGAFSLLLAQALPKGQVLAVDIDTKLLDILKQRAEAAGIGNIKTMLLGQLQQTKPSVDKVFSSTVLHEVEDKQEFLTLYWDLLKPNGQIYIVEFNDHRRSLVRDDGIKRKFITSAKTEAELKRAGYKKGQTIRLNDLIYLTTAQK